MSSCITGCRALNASSSGASPAVAKSFSARVDVGLAAGVANGDARRSRPWPPRRRAFAAVSSSTAPPNCWICCELRYSTFSTGSGWRSLGKQFGHLQRRQHGHRRVEADVVFAAERFGVGQGPGGDQLLQVGLAAVELFDEDRLQLVGPACFAADRPGRRTCRTPANRPLRRQRPCGSPDRRERRPQAGDQHSAADGFQKIAAGSGGHGKSPL